MTWQVVGRVWNASFSSCCFCQCVAVTLLPSPQLSLLFSRRPALVHAAQSWVDRSVQLRGVTGTHTQLSPPNLAFVTNQDDISALTCSLFCILSHCVQNASGEERWYHGAHTACGWVDRSVQLRGLISSYTKQSLPNLALITNKDDVSALICWLSCPLSPHVQNAGGERTGSSWSLLRDPSTISPFTNTSWEWASDLLPPRDGIQTILLLIHRFILRSSTKMLDHVLLSSTTLVPIPKRLPQLTLPCFGELIPAPQRHRFLCQDYFDFMVCSEILPSVSIKSWEPKKLTGMWPCHYPWLFSVQGSISVTSAISSSSLGSNSCGFELV